MKSQRAVEFGKIGDEKLGVGYTVSEGFLRRDTVISDVLLLHDFQTYEVKDFRHFHLCEKTARFVSTRPRGVAD